MHRVLLSTVLVILAILSIGIAGAAGPGATERASVSSTGEQSNSWSLYASLSADGRFVAFVSDANDLVPSGSNGYQQVYVRERQTGGIALASVSSAGEQAYGHSLRSSISADGRFVAFGSYASNLVPSDGNGMPDAFVRDLVVGTTVRVSVSSSGQEGNGVTERPSISANGRFVAFESASNNLVARDTNGASDIFVRDLMIGSTERVNLSHSGQQANDGGNSPSISADGRYVAFSSGASNLVLGGDTNGVSDAFVRDRQAGTTERASESSSGAQGERYSGSPSISADGRFVAFSSGASNLVPGDVNGQDDVFVHDRQTGTTVLASVSSSAEQADNFSWYPFISGDGRFVTFHSPASNLVSGDTNGGYDIFVHELALGDTTPTPTPTPRGRRP